jgi:hypothetical protein
MKSNPLIKKILSRSFLQIEVVPKPEILEQPLLTIILERHFTHFTQLTETPGNGKQAPIPGLMIYCLVQLPLRAFCAAGNPLMVS